MKQPLAIILLFGLLLSGCDAASDSESYIDASSEVIIAISTSNEIAENTSDVLDVSDPVFRIFCIEAPIEVFTLPGSENQMKGTLMWIDGTVITIDEFVLHDDSIQPALNIDAELGGFILLPDSPDNEPAGWNDLEPGDSMRFYFAYTGMVVGPEIGAGAFIGYLPNDPDSLIKYAKEETNAIDEALNGPDIDSPKITRREFFMISIGDTYEEVCEIIGGEGMLLSSTKNISSYQWEGEGSVGANAILVFVDGKVKTKAQYGLG